MADDERDRISRLSILYQENARLAATFWEWQHKTLTIFTSGVAAVLAIEAWMFNRHFGSYLAAPLVAGSLLSALCVLFARRNREILNATYAIGAALEREIKDGLDLDLPESRAAYEWLLQSPSFYRRWLAPIFSATAILFLLAAIAAGVHPPKKTSSAPAPRSQIASAIAQPSTGRRLRTAVSFAASIRSRVIIRG